MSLRVDWETLKSFVDSRQLPLQYIDLHNTYFLKAFDGPFELDCQIDKKDPVPDPSDQKDFEDNYKANANSSTVTKVSLTGGKAGYSFEGDAILVQGTTGATTNHDFTISEMGLAGGSGYFENVTMGDYIECLLVHPVSGDTLGTFIKKWYVPNKQIFIASDYDAKFFDASMVGLSLRLRYHSVGILPAANPVGFINFDILKKQA